jgi:hypothetical protein
MSFVATAVIGTSVIGGVMSSNAQKKAAKGASQAQTAAADQSIAEQRRQFDAIQQLLSPYVQAGNSGLVGQQELIGLMGPERQQQAITALEQGPEFSSLVRTGEEAILQSASATGGLRGGNTQEALAKFRPEVLSSLINQQFSRLGGLSTMGQNAAVGQANAGQNMANNISGALGDRGAAQAGYQLARGNATANLWGNIAGAVGTVGGLGYLDGLGGMFRSPRAEVLPGTGQQNMRPF